MQASIIEAPSFAPELVDHVHYPLLVEVRNLIRERFPLGAVNRVDVAETEQLSLNEVINYLSACSFQGQLLDDVSSVDIEKVTDITQALRGGNCGLFTNYAIGYLKKNYPDLAVQAMYFKNIDHVVVLIGREEGSSLTDPRAWRNAVICDLWADRYYLAEKLSHEKRTAAKIPFYQPITFSGRPTRLRTTDGDYLSERVEVFDGEANRRYDENLVAWVCEDQRRLARPEPTAPQHLTTPSAHYRREEILPLLKNISKIELDWKYSKNNAIAWLECSDEHQAHRLYATLRLTKAMVVSLQKNKDTGHLVVTCKHFDVSLMRRLGALLPTDDSFLRETLQGFSFT